MRDLKNSQPCAARFRFRVRKIPLLRLRGGVMMTKGDGALGQTNIDAGPDTQECVEDISMCRYSPVAMAKGLGAIFDNQCQLW
jgi:hypothetical protein